MSPGKPVRARCRDGGGVDVLQTVERDRRVELDVVSGPSLQNRGAATNHNPDTMTAASATIDYSTLLPHQLVTMD
jgi:hypothetical protein